MPCNNPLRTGQLSLMQQLFRLPCHQLARMLTHSFNLLTHSLTH
jgi:hypothetical protein